MGSDLRSSSEGGTRADGFSDAFVKPRRRFRIRYLFYFAGASVFLILFLLVGLALILAPGKLPESAKAPPPALREHLEKMDAQRPANPSRSIEAGPGPLAAAIGYVYDPALIEQLNAAFYTRSGELKNIYAAKPLDAETTALVEKHRDMLERFYAWADRGGSFADAVSALDGNAGYWMFRMAMADAERAWRDGNSGEALRIVQTLFRVFESTAASGARPSNGPSDPHSIQLLRMLQHWIESGPMPPKAAEALRSPLDRMAKRECEQLDDTESYWREYASRREDSIRRLEQPWYSVAYGFRPNARNNFARIGGFRVPDPFRIADMALGAIHAKRRAPEILAAWDDWNQEQIRRALTDSPGAFDPQTAAKERPRDAPPEILKGIVMDQTSAVHERGQDLQSLLQCNLLRAGLTVLADPSAQPASDDAIKADSANPWRDPFSGGALQVLEHDGKTAIFSRGPLGGSIDVHEIFDGGNENVLLLPAMQK